MPTYTPLQSIELTSASASVTFSNIPQNYQDLVVSINGYAAALDGVGVGYRINGDSSSLYSLTYLLGNGTTTASARASNSNAGYVSYGVGWNTAVTSPSVIISSINNYSNTSTFKTVLSRSNSASGSYPGAEAIISLYRSTSAINSLTFFGYSTMTFAAGTTFDLYGISPVAANNAQAFGGTEIYYDSSYVYHVFKGSGTFTPYRNLTCDYLVVAGGGGGGGGDRSGGGGAGGLRSTVTATGGGGSLPSALSLTANTSYTVTVGAGGAGATNGSNSVFSTVTSTGGGYGGYGYPSQSAVGNGGSGGGGSGNTGGSAGTGTSNEGYAGGAGANTGAGGGGGAGAVGSAGSSSNGGTGGNGGVGVQITAFSTATGTGANSGYYAGGGGGYGSSVGSTGGSGGGGNGEDYDSSVRATNGVTNTGGGGGGQAGSVATNGGSGLVIIRYAR